MNKIAQEALLVIMIIMAISAALMLSDAPVKGTLNCDIAEISPDITSSMREQCRQLRESK